MLVGLTELAPPTLHVGLARLLYATRLFNVTITNVPGPPERMYSFGWQLTDMGLIVPLAADNAVGIAVISHAGRMTFGLIDDRASVADLDVLGEGSRRLCPSWPRSCRGPVEPQPTGAAHRRQRRGRDAERDAKVVLLCGGVQ